MALSRAPETEEKPRLPNIDTHRPRAELQELLSSFFDKAKTVQDLDAGIELSRIHDFLVRIVKDDSLEATLKRLRTSLKLKDGAPEGQDPYCYNLTADGGIEPKRDVPTDEDLDTNYEVFLAQEAAEARIFEPLKKGLFGEKFPEELSKLEELLRYAQKIGLIKIVDIYEGRFDAIHKGALFLEANSNTHLNEKRDFDKRASYVTFVNEVIRRFTLAFYGNPEYLAKLAEKTLAKTRQSETAYGEKTKRAIETTYTDEAGKQHRAVICFQDSPDQDGYIHVRILEEGEDQVLRLKPRTNGENKEETHYHRLNRSHSGIRTDYPWLMPLPHVLAASKGIYPPRDPSDRRRAGGWDNEW